MAWRYLHKAISQRREAHRKAIESHNDDEGECRAYGNLGAVLGWQGRQPEAVEAFRKAIVLQPDRPEVHYGLGLALGEQGKMGEAIPHFRKAIELKADYGEAHANLGFALKGEGEFQEALAALERSRDLLPPDHSGRPAIQRLVQACQRQADLEAKLPAILKDEFQPASASERARNSLRLAAKRLFATAARFYDEAFRDQPDLATDVMSFRRYHAAGAAAQAGHSQGQDRASLSDDDRVGWRRKPSAGCGPTSRCWRSRARHRRTGADAALLMQRALSSPGSASKPRSPSSWSPSERNAGSCGRLWTPCWLG